MTSLLLAANVLSKIITAEPLYKGTLKSSTTQQQPSLWSGNDYCNRK